MTKKQIIQLIAVIMLGCLGFGASAKPQPYPILKFSHKTFDFGPVYRGDKLSHRFDFVNDGDAPLVIQGVHAACGCTVASVETGKEYASGEKGYLEVQFDSSDFVGPIAKVITVMSNEKLFPDRALTIRAVIKTEVEADPPLIDFGNILAEKEGVRSIRVKPIAGFPLQVSSIHFDQQFLEAKLEGKASDGSFGINVRLKEGLPPQFLKTLLTVQTNSKHLPELLIPVRGSIKGNIDVSPAYLEFGAISASSQARRSVNLRGPMGGFEVKGHRVELNVNGRPVEGGTQMVTLKSKGLGPSQDNKNHENQAITIELANDARYAGSVHGKLFLETTDKGQKEIAVDFYAFFR